MSIKNRLKKIEKLANISDESEIMEITINFIGRNKEISATITKVRQKDGSW